RGWGLQRRRGRPCTSPERRAGDRGRAVDSARPGVRRFAGHRGLDATLECRYRGVDAETVGPSQRLDAGVITDDRSAAAVLPAELPQQARIQRRLERLVSGRKYEADLGILRRSNQVDQVGDLIVGAGKYYNRHQTLIVLSTRRMRPPSGSSASSSSVIAWRARPIGVTSCDPTRSPVVSYTPRTSSGPSSLTDGVWLKGTVAVQSIARSWSTTSGSAAPPPARKRAGGSGS